MSDGKKAAYEEMQDDIHRYRLQKLTLWNKSELLAIFDEIRAIANRVAQNELVANRRTFEQLDKLYEIASKLP